MTNPNTRVILPREVTDAEIEAAHNAMFEEPYTCETDPMIGAGLDAARTAAPNAGRVTAKMLEAAALGVAEANGCRPDSIAACDSTYSGCECREFARAAISTLGLEVEG